MAQMSLSRRGYREIPGGWQLVTYNFNSLSITPTLSEIIIYFQTSGGLWPTNQQLSNALCSEKLEKFERIKILVAKILEGSMLHGDELEEYTLWIRTFLNSGSVKIGSSSDNITLDSSYDITDISTYSITDEILYENMRKKYGTKWDKVNI